MSVYIKGMEMPDSCNHCRFAVDGWCYAYGKPNVDALANNGVTNWCPLVPVTPHGRLIDADAFERRCMFDPEIEDMQDVIYALRDYPTIIPADPPKEGEG